MNMKLHLILGAAACAAIAGCKAPKAGSSGSAPASVRPQPVKVAETPKKVETPAVEKKETEKPGCKCPAGTVHETACKCGAADCGCKVKPAEPAPEYTLYRIKGGDTLSGICAAYGLKQKKVLELNPGLSPDKIFAGRKIKLPGVIELKGDDAKAEAPKPAAKSAAKSAKSAKASTRATKYTGATKQYVVKSGDTLGKIALDNGVTVKCLMDMNSLKNKMIRIGQKLKVPAEKPVVAKAAKSEANAEAPAEAKPVEKKEAAPAVEAPATPAEATPAVEAPAAPAAAEPAATEAPAAPAAEAQPAAETAAVVPAAVQTKTHVVQAGEDAFNIAMKYGVSPSNLLDLNNLKNNDTLAPGTVLKLPANAQMQ